MALPSSTVATVSIFQMRTPRPRRPRNWTRVTQCRVHLDVPTRSDLSPSLFAGKPSKNVVARDQTLGPCVINEPLPGTRPDRQKPGSRQRPGSFLAVLAASAFLERENLKKSPEDSGLPSALIEGGCTSEVAGAASHLHGLLPPKKY